MTDDEILELRMNSDIGETTIRRWLRELLLSLWRDGDGFSGKRPFGNSGWQFDVYKPLIKAGLIKGTLDKDGCVDEVDWIDGDNIVNRLIVRMCEGVPEVLPDYEEDDSVSDINIQIQAFFQGDREICWNCSSPQVPRVGEEICMDDGLRGINGLNLPDIYIVTSVTWHLDGSRMVHVCCEEATDS